MLDKSKIAILTTVANFDLYYKTSQLFPQGIRKYVIKGTNGMHGIHSLFYMIKKLNGKNIDWLILADEDVIFEDANAVFSIINDMHDKNITACGVRDGGVVKHRNYNPHAINTFFAVLNFKEILNIWSKKEVKQNQYIKPNEFKLKTDSLEFDFDEMSLFEPYYCFFLWLIRKHKKILYLESYMHDDITNIVFFLNKKLFYHTWYARVYGKNIKHTKRIDSILSVYQPELESIAIDTDFILFNDVFFAKKQLFKKLKRRIIARLKLIIK